MPDIEDTATPPSRVERKRNQRMARILDTAADELGRKGINRFSMEDLAEHLDVTKGSLYHYFPSKDDLVISGIEVLANRIMVDLRAVVEDHNGSATERLRELLEKQITVVVWEFPASVELFTLREPEDAAQRVKNLRAEHDALFRSLVEDGLTSGEFKVASIAASLECIHSAINLAPMWIGGASRRVARKRIDELIDTLLMLVGVLPDEA